MTVQQDVDLAKKHFEDRVKITLGPVELQELMEDPRQKETFILLDVRDVEGYEKEHIPGAINIPKEALERRLQELPKNKTIIVYCWSLVCHLAAKAGLILTDHGYFTRELEGGIAEWKRHRMPLTSESNV